MFYHLSIKCTLSITPRAPPSWSAPALYHFQCCQTVDCYTLLERSVCINLLCKRPGSRIIRKMVGSTCFSLEAHLIKRFTSSSKQSHFQIFLKHCSQPSAFTVLMSCRLVPCRGPKLTVSKFTHAKEYAPSSFVKILFWLLVCRTARPRYKSWRVSFRVRVHNHAAATNDI